MKLSTIKNFFPTSYRLCTTLALFLCSFPMRGRAQLTVPGGAPTPLEFSLLNILIFIERTLVPFFISVGFLFFVWGMFRYFIAGGASDDDREKGKNLMVFATVGMVLIFIFWGIVNLLAFSSFSPWDLTPNFQVPAAP